MNRGWVGGILLVIGSLPASALPDPLESGLLKCAAETQQNARLACFDALVTTLPKAKADEFGLTAQIARNRGPTHAPTVQDDALPARIVSLQQAPRGEVIFTLDNGQIWVQTQVEPGKQFLLGDSVRIEHGAMSSFWLSADKARKTKVRRIS